MEIEPYDPSRLDAIVRLALRAWVKALAIPA